ncbi:hypothetical protein ACVU7I_10045, partial [Patulibacter sp. S7RM1-6]
DLLVGRWVGLRVGDAVEEVWSRVAPDAMMGMFCWRRGDGLWLLPDGTGGAFVVGRDLPERGFPVRCERRPRRPADCHPSSRSAFLIAETGTSRGRRPPSAWRYRPGADRLVAVDDLPRVARDALDQADELRPGSAGSVVAATSAGLDRIPLDPAGTPTALLRTFGAALSPPSVP